VNNVEIEVELAGDKVVGVRARGHNWLRVGHRVKVLSTPGRRNSYMTRVLRFYEERGQMYVEVAQRSNGALRLVPLAQIEHKAQTKAGERLDA
jgi:hypothetical protein